MNLVRHENATSWFLGINPRGLVPVLVNDGAVYIESNDILEYLDQQIPSAKPAFFPEEARAWVRESLALEQSLQTHLRTISMGFLLPRLLVKKSPKTLDTLENAGPPDASRAKEVAWWRGFFHKQTGEKPTETSGSSDYDGGGQALHRCFFVPPHTSATTDTLFYSTSR